MVKSAKPAIRMLTLVLMIGTAVPIFVYASDPASRDFIAYWSAGHLLVEGADPYSQTSVLRIERSSGYTESRPLVMRNPPWALFLTVPLGEVSARIGFLIWSASLIGSIAIFIRIFAVGAQNRIFIYCFPPVVASLATGQTSPFLLLGFAVFLWSQDKHPFLAGTALLMPGIKPHLFLILWPVLLADAVRRKNRRLILGAACAFASATLIAMLFDPHVWTHYIDFLRSARIGEEFIPTVATFLRVLICPKSQWVQLLPSGVALFWAIWFYTRHRSDWNWSIHGSLLLLVAVLTSPYAWMTDEVVLLPAILLALSNSKRPRNTSAIYALTSGTALVMLISRVPLTSGVYAWTPIAWLLLYLYARGHEAIDLVHT